MAARRRRATARDRWRAKKSRDETCLPQPPYRKAGAAHKPDWPSNSVMSESGPGRFSDLGKARVLNYAGSTAKYIDGARMPPDRSNDGRELTNASETE